MINLRRHAVIFALAAIAALLAPSAAAAKAETEDVLVVSNNWAGTADLVDPGTFERLERINVIPDAEERIAENYRAAIRRLA